MNPRYLLWLRATNTPPGETRGYIDWIMSRWGDYMSAHDRPRTDDANEADQARFDRWLTEWVERGGAHEPNQSD